MRGGRRQTGRQCSSAAKSRHTYKSKHPPLRSASISRIISDGFYRFPYKSLLQLNHFSFIYIKLTESPALSCSEMGELDISCSGQKGGGASLQEEVWRERHPGTKLKVCFCCCCFSPEVLQFLYVLSAAGAAGFTLTDNGWVGQPNGSACCLQIRSVLVN